MKPAAENITLVGSMLFSSRTAEKDMSVVEAQYFVRVENLDTPGVADYKLTAMTDEAYKTWWMEHNLYADDGDPEDIHPLHIPDEVVGISGLVEYVNQTWLDTKQPHRIGDIGQYLLYLEPDADEG